MRREEFSRGLIRQLAAARGDCAPGSFMNCHAVGLHSIVLRERPMVRMFVTTPDHELWRTGADNIPSAIAFHSHRTDLVLETVRGGFYNWLATDEPTMGHVRMFDRFRWDSAINGGTGTFSRLPLRHGFYMIASLLFAGDSTAMAASEVHTVEVARGERAAWLVYEGAPDELYDAISYSASDLTAFVPGNLYRPMTFQESVSLLSWVCS